VNKTSFTTLLQLTSFFIVPTRTRIRLVTKVGMILRLHLIQPRLWTQRLLLPSSSSRHQQHQTFETEHTQRQNTSRSRYAYMAPICAGLKSDLHLGTSLATKKLWIIIQSASRLPSTVPHSRDSDQSIQRKAQIPRKTFTFTYTPFSSPSAKMIAPPCSETYLQSSPHRTSTRSHESYGK
jgi:hypothetical protein